MIPRSRIRRIAKWSGVVVCVVMVIAWVVSTQWLGAVYWQSSIPLMTPGSSAGSGAVYSDTHRMARATANCAAPA